MEHRFAEIAKVAGCNLNQFNGWNARGYLRTKLLATTSGVARNYTFENGLEICFVSALADIGMPLEMAPGLITGWLQEYAAGTLKEFYVYYPKANFGFCPDPAHSSLRRLGIIAPDNENKISGEIIDDDAAPDPSLPAELIFAKSFHVIALRNIADQMEQLYGIRK